MGPEIQPLIKKLKLETAFRELHKTAIRALALSNPKTKVLEMSFTQSEVAWAINREEFDGWMARHAKSAGVDLQINTLIEENRFAGGSWELSLVHEEGISEVMARFFIDATGRRRPSRNSHRKNFYACMATYKNIQNLQNKVALHFIPKGHVGLNSMGGDKAVLCAYFEESYLRNSNGNLDSLVEQFKKINMNISPNFNSSNRTSPWRTCLAEPDQAIKHSENHIFYIGDAVTMANPIIGGGIPIAMESACLLGDELIGAKAKNLKEKEIVKNYTRQWSSSILRRMQFSIWLGKIERSLFLSSLVFKGIQLIPQAIRPLFRQSRKNFSLIFN